MRRGGDQFAPVGGFPLAFAKDLLSTFAPHPVAAHFSNGLIPVAALFLILWYFTGNAVVEKVSFYVLAVGVFSLPVSLVSGFRDWKRRYAGRNLPVFKAKLVIATLTTSIGFVALSLRYIAGEPTLIYAALLFAMVSMVVVLGHLGAKLVFYWKKAV